MKILAEYVKPVLAYLVVALSFAYFFVITFTEKKADPQIIIAIVGALTSSLNYYFGSSQGASKKDETIANLSASPTVGNSESTLILGKKE